MLREATARNDDIGEKLRKYGESFHLKTDIVRRRLLQKDCIDHGWVMTGYPLTGEEFETMDNMPTPPNRVIFLNVDWATCKQRAVSVGVDWCTGKRVPVGSGPRVVPHPGINEAEIDAEATEFQNVMVDSSEYHGQVCGRPTLSNAQLTRTNNEAQLGEWPWQVAVFRIDEHDNSTIYMGGSAIISRTAVLTKVHCVTYYGQANVPAKQIVIVAGITNYKDLSHPGMQRFIANQIVVHPKYRYGVGASALAVVRVPPFTYTEYVRPVCMWGPDYDKTKHFGQQATVVGFSEIRRPRHNLKPSEVLRAASMVVQNDSSCIDYVDKIYSDDINDITFCAGNDGPTIYYYDLGSGLVIPQTQSDNTIVWYLRGVLCYTTSTSYPIFCDVAADFDWIMNNSGINFTNNSEKSAGWAFLILINYLLMMIIVK